MDSNEKEIMKKIISIANNRMITKKVRIPSRLEKLSLQWLRVAPFFSEFLLRFNYFYTDDISTIGVNSTKGRINLYINKEFMNGGGKQIKIGEDGLPVTKKDDKGNDVLNEKGKIQYEMVDWKGLSDRELEGVLIHEIMHLIRLHHERIKDSQPYIWNIAGDMLINDDIKDMKIDNRKVELPDGAIYLEMAKKEGYKGEPVTEPLYDWLLSERDKMMKNSFLIEGTGSSSGSNDFDKKFNSKIDDHNLLNESDELAESTIKEVINTGRIRGWGSISGEAVTKLENLCKPAKVNWRSLLRKNISSHIFAHGNIYENSWSKRNRRHLPLPGIKKLSTRAVIGVDTSGSISNESLKQFFTEIERIIKNIQNLSVVQWDTKVKDVWNRYKKNDWKKINIKGRGGTDAQDMFDWMIKNKRRKDLLIMFTDGYFSYDYDLHRIKTLWCVTDNTQRPKGGQIIYIDVDEK